MSQELSLIAESNGILFTYNQLGIVSETGTPPIISDKNIGITGLAYI